MDFVLGNNIHVTVSFFFEETISSICLFIDWHMWSLSSFCRNFNFYTISLWRDFHTIRKRAWKIEFQTVSMQSTEWSMRMVQFNAINLFNDWSIDWKIFLWNTLRTNENASRRLLLVLRMLFYCNMIEHIFEIFCNDVRRTGKELKRHKRTHKHFVHFWRNTKRWFVTKTSRTTIQSGSLP